MFVVGWNVLQNPAAIDGSTDLSAAEIVVCSLIVPSDGGIDGLAALRGTGNCRRWRRAAEKLDEAPQVLSGCGQ